MPKERAVVYLLSVPVQKKVDEMDVIGCHLLVPEKPEKVPDVPDIFSSSERCWPHGANAALQRLSDREVFARHVLAGGQCRVVAEPVCRHDLIARLDD